VLQESYYKRNWYHKGFYLWGGTTLIVSQLGCPIFILQLLASGWGHLCNNLHIDVLASSLLFPLSQHHQNFHQVETKTIATCPTTWVEYNLVTKCVIYVILEFEYQPLELDESPLDQDALFSCMS
jgi:hypothetical protein